MEKQRSIFVLVPLMVAGWACLTYAVVCLRQPAPAPPIEWDQMVYEAGKKALADLPHIVDAIPTPEERYRLDVRQYRLRCLGLLGLLALGGLVTFRSGFLLSESFDKSGWVGGTIAVFFGPLSVTWVLHRTRNV
jgi:hypothetical protein